MTFQSSNLLFGFLHGLERNKSKSQNTTESIPRAFFIKTRKRPHLGITICGYLENHPKNKVIATEVIYSLNGR